MKKYIYYLISIAFLSAACEDYDSQGQQLPAPMETISEAEKLVDLLKETKWETQNVANGIVWKKFHFLSIFNSRQYITVFDIDLNQKNIKVEIPYVSAGFLLTSAAAEKAGADVAFNGSYFDTSKGGSTVFFKQAGNVINQTRNGFTSYRENGALFIDAAGKVQVTSKPAAGWTSLSAVDALAAGPLLLQDGQSILQIEEAFNISRHPRTAIGVTDTNHLIVVVVDGRSSQSQGLSTLQLRDLMEGFGCKSAVNMDGGGSSTAWVKGQGVVNHPTDNAKFDHEGERGVATVFTVKAN